MTESWRPTASIDALKARARILHDIRAFFVKRDFTEVQVPSISYSGVTDVNIDSIPVQLNQRQAYLHTSPEYPMKRLLAAGMSDCYYLSSVYRQGESGALHNPEFTMLEWYRLDFDMRQLIEEVNGLVTHVLGIDAVDIRSVSYSEAMQNIADLDVFNCNIDDVKCVLTDLGFDYPDMALLDDYLDLLMSLYVLPKLSVGSNKFNIVNLHSYPVSQAALAEEVKDESGRAVAARFEVVVNGLEIANGYQECRDAEILQKRFIRDNQVRSDLKKFQMPIDTLFLRAHESGLPACSGVALGVDRLCMLALDKENISEVIAFPINRC